jgi:hypothetical protein
VTGKRESKRGREEEEEGGLITRWSRVVHDRRVLRLPRRYPGAFRLVACNPSRGRWMVESPEVRRDKSRGVWGCGGG